jgi:dienelactone hydrolase
MTVGVQLHDFDLMPMSFHDRTRDVLVSKAQGRPVIIMHEIFGLTPAVVDFARLLTDAEFKVYMPVLFGSSDPAAGKVRGIADFLCVMSEFKLLSNNDPGPWADWIRELASLAYTENAPGKGVGVIGLCLTGNLALSAALNPCVTAPVMSEPSLPFFRAGGLHVSAAELSAVKMRVSHQGLVIRGYRYEKDWLCRRARFKELSSTFNGGFEGTTIPARNCSLHSVFTEHLRDGNGNFRHGELRTLIEYLKARI